MDRPVRVILPLGTSPQAQSAPSAWVGVPRRGDTVYWTVDAVETPFVVFKVVWGEEGTIRVYLRSSEQCDGVVV